MKFRNLKYSIVIFISTITSCTSQKSDTFDLSKNILGTHIDSIIDSNVKFRKNISANRGIGNDVIETSTEEIMNFNGINLSGYTDENSSYLKNYVKFFFSKKDNIIREYQIYTHQTEKSNLLIQQLEQLLGKPNFTGYFNKETRKKNEFDAKIWEDKVNDCTYLLNVTIQKNGKECWLFIVDNNASEFYNRALGLAEFNKWEKFKKFKKRFEKPESYTYQDYIKDQTEKGDEYIGILSE